MSQPIDAEPTPLLRPWGPVASVVAKLVGEYPNLAPRLLLLPAKAIHATAAALLAANESGLDLDKVATRVRMTHPRDLLSSAIPDVAPTLYNTLGRAELPAWAADEYLRLNEVLASTAAPMVLDGRPLSVDRVEDAHALIGVDPIVWRARKAVKGAYSRDRLIILLGVLRDAGLLREVAGLPDGAGRESLRRRLRADFKCARRPNDDFPTPTGWSRAETVKDLWAIGTRLRLCVRPDHWGAGEYLLRLMTGQSVYLHHGEQDLLAEVRRSAMNRRCIVQVRGLRNRPAERPLTDALEKDLRSAGLQVTPTTVEDALNDLLRPANDFGGLLDDNGMDADQDAA